MRKPRTELTLLEWLAIPFAALLLYIFVCAFLLCMGAVWPGVTQ